MTTVVICAGGPTEEMMDFSQFKGSTPTYFVGADRGALHLLNMDIMPSDIIGDFDSVSEDEWRYLNEIVGSVEKLPAEKDETDTEAALKLALKYEPENIVITGVTGGRLDHFMSAVHLVMRFQKEYPGINLSIAGKSNEMRLLLPGIHELLKNQLKYISFFAFDGPVKDVTLKGFKYETEHALITPGTTKFTSNEFASDVCTISFSSGICLMIRGTDV